MPSATEQPPSQQSNQQQEQHAPDMSVTSDQQREQVQKVYKIKVEANEKWCIVQYKWWKSWCAYTGFSERTNVLVPVGPPSSSATSASTLKYDRPPPIDNSDLQGDDEGTLKRGLVEGFDYHLVIKPVYDLLVQWYGGGPEFVRETNTLGNEARVTLYPVFVTLKDVKSDGEPDDSTAQKRQFTPDFTFATLLEQLNGKTEEEGTDNGEANVRLWYQNKSDEKTAESKVEEVKEEENKTAPKASFTLVRNNMFKRDLSSFDIPANGVILVERKSNNTWARQSKDWRAFEQNDIIDAQDTVGKWYESTVVKVDEEKKQILVHYNGWESRWDQWLDFTSDKVADLGTHTYGPYRKTVSYSSSSGGYMGGSSGGYSGGFYSSYYERTNLEGAPSVNGAVGLRNLGNTCFMNSTLQCMSNTPKFVDHFLSDAFLSEINRDNPLGWKGRIADEFGALLKEMWSNKYKAVAPSKFKQALGEFAPRFSGFQQQDSSELLSFLLDGLHEDLNQILRKPATNAVESNGRPDAIVAKESWDTYLLRNKSVVVGTFQGQLKSRVTCPFDDCGRVSITFDPFMFLSVPLPQAADKAQPVIFVPSDPNSPIKVIRPMVAKLARIYELKNAISQELGISSRRLVVGDVWRGKLHRIFADEEGVNDIYGEDKVFVFDVPELETAANNSYRLGQVVNVVLPADNPSNSYRYISVDPFGIPVPLFIPRDSTNAQLKERIVAATQRLVRPNTESVPFIIRPADNYGLYSKDETILPEDDAPIVMRESSYRQDRPTYFAEWRSNDDYDGERAQVPAVVKESYMANHRSSHSLHINDCLRAFTAEEVLSEQDLWYCSNCKDFRRASKKMDVWKLPSTLIIHLKRFSYSDSARDKIDTFVDFPVDGLDLAPFCVNDDERGSAIYDLYAVSNHMGGLGGGHYTAYGKNRETGQWFCFDDEHVRSVSSNDIKSSNAYVLFYQRRSATETPVPVAVKDTPATESTSEPSPPTNN